MHVVLKKNSVRGFIRSPAQCHVGDFEGMITFLGIAFFARRNQVRPRVCSTLGARYHMIDREIALGTAILALEIITLEYILPGKINALVGSVYISVQTYH